MSEKEPIAKAYIICPVRGADKNYLLEDFVDYIESEGIKCHYPPRDMDQTLEGIDIVKGHLKAMLESDMVIVWWNESSYGSHVDLGMALMKAATGKPLLRLNEYECKKHSYGTVLKDIAIPAIINNEDDFLNALKAVAGGIAVAGAK